MISVKEHIREEVLAALKTVEGSLDAPPLEFMRTRQKEHGDTSVNVAMILAKRLNQKPRELAQKIVDRLDLSPDFVSKVEIAGPGFINFFYSDAYLAAELQNIGKAGKDFGKHDIGKGIKTNVEFVSANPTGPLTLGHGRNAVLGDVIARILENAGYEVTREYYYNDAGRQMQRLGESVRLRYLELTGEAVEFTDDLYQGDYINDIADKIKRERGEALKKEANTEFFKAVAEKQIFEEIRATLKNIGIEFDLYFNERSLFDDGQIEKTLEALNQKELVYEKEDATWLKTSEMESIHGKASPEDKVIVKNTGEPTYRLPDIAYHLSKFERGFEYMVDLFGSDHKDSYPDVMAAVNTLGYDVSKVHVIIYQFVTLMRGNEKVKMSKRLASGVTIDELVEEVGSDAFRYFMSMRSPNSHLNFDLELAKKQDTENPVFYVQYMHARCNQIAVRAAADYAYAPSPDHLNLLSHEKEIEVIKKLIEFRELTEALTASLEPHTLTTYLEELGSLYHSYQQEGNKNQELRFLTEHKKLSEARLFLVNAVKNTVANGLRILGVSAPDRMD